MFIEKDEDSLCFILFFCKCILRAINAYSDLRWQQETRKGHRPAIKDKLKERKNHTLD